jgi:hypothetical protein
MPSSSLRYIRYTSSNLASDHGSGHPTERISRTVESTRRKPMSEHDTETGKVPLVQQLLDNPFLLLFLGVLIPMVVYTLWGVIDILTIPLAK